MCFPLFRLPKRESCSNVIIFRSSFHFTLFVLFFKKNKKKR